MKKARNSRALGIDDVPQAGRASRPVRGAAGASARPPAGHARQPRQGKPARPARHTRRSQQLRGEQARLGWLPAQARGRFGQQAGAGVQRWVGGCCQGTRPGEKVDQGSVRLEVAAHEEASSTGASVSSFWLVTFCTHELIHAPLYR